MSNRIKDRLRNLFRRQGSPHSSEVMDRPSVPEEALSSKQDDSVTTAIPVAIEDASASAPGEFGATDAGQLSAGVGDHKKSSVSGSCGPSQDADDQQGVKVETRNEENEEIRPKSPVTPSASKTSAQVKMDSDQMFTEEESATTSQSQKSRSHSTMEYEGKRPNIEGEPCLIPSTGTKDCDGNDVLSTADAQAIPMPLCSSKLGSNSVTASEMPIAAKESPTVTLKKDEEMLSLHRNKNTISADQNRLGLSDAHHFSSHSHSQSDLKHSCPSTDGKLPLQHKEKPGGVQVSDTVSGFTFSQDLEMFSALYSEELDRLEQRLDLQAAILLKNGQLPTNEKRGVFHADQCNPAVTYTTHDLASDAMLPVVCESWDKSEQSMTQLSPSLDKNWPEVCKLHEMNPKDEVTMPRDMKLKGVALVEAEKQSIRESDQVVTERETEQVLQTDYVPVGDGSEARGKPDEDSSTDVEDPKWLEAKTGMVDLYTLGATVLRQKGLVDRKKTKFKKREAVKARLQQYLQELTREHREMTRLLDDLNKQTSALAREAHDIRTNIASICDITLTKVSRECQAHRLEPSCYRRYVNIRTLADAVSLQSALRARQKALNDLEVLTYRRQLLLQHHLPSSSEDRPSVKKVGRATHKPPQAAKVSKLPGPIVVEPRPHSVQGKQKRLHQAVRLNPPQLHQQQNGATAVVVEIFTDTMTSSWSSERTHLESPALSSSPPDSTTDVLTPSTTTNVITNTTNTATANSSSSTISNGLAIGVVNIVQGPPPQMDDTEV